MRIIRTFKIRFSPLILPCLHGIYLEKNKFTAKKKIYDIILDTLQDLFIRGVFFK